jgi:hypothetical protein
LRYTAKDAIMPGGAVTIYYAVDAVNFFRGFYYAQCLP